MRSTRYILPVLVFALVFACVTTAFGSDLSTESTTQAVAVIKLSAKTSITIPAGSTQTDVATQMSTVNVTVPPMYAFGITFKGKVFAATPASVAAVSPLMVAAMKASAQSPEFAAIVFNTAFTATSTDPINLSVQLVRLAKARIQTAVTTNIVAPLRAVARIAPTPIQYKYSYAHKHMVIIYPRDGYAPFSSDIENAFIDAYASACVAGSSLKSPTTVCVYRPVKPTIYRRDQLGRCIVVDKSQRKLFVYNKGVRTTTVYGVAIGMPAFPTPVGTFQIGTMRMNPTWSNTGSAWAIDMPASIGPGYTNPLGLRAMNLNTLDNRDTGYRIHGTSKRYSIGHAASHGCVRVYNPNIVKLFDLMKTGNRVIIQP